VNIENAAKPLPLSLSPGDLYGRDLLTWARSNRAEFHSLLATHGAILLSGFDVPTADAFRRAFHELIGSPMNYVEQSSARTEVSDGIYTSTEYPAERQILLHNEQSYNINFPRFISFYCNVPALEGGETPLADTRRILHRIDPSIRQRLTKLGYLYTRHFGGRMQMSWEKAFQIKDAEALERYCGMNQITFEWLGPSRGPRLKTRQHRHVIARHPITSELVWFNHATFFHESSLDADLRQMLHELCGPDDLPHATSYGDGSPFEADTIQHLRDAYKQEETIFPWRAGDVLVLDNMLVAHARRPFRGPRKILVAMAETCHWSTVVP
jgi:alpha-ketoglutarate-dependent taurine dioxygenase